MKKTHDMIVQFFTKKRVMPVTIKKLFLYTFLIVLLIANYFYHSGGIMSCGHNPNTGKAVGSSEIYNGIIFNSYTEYFGHNDYCDSHRLKHIYYFKDREALQSKAISEGYCSIISVNIIHTTVTILAILFCLYKMVMICAHEIRRRRLRQLARANISD